MTYQEVYKYAQEKNRHFSAEQFSPLNWVHIIHDDGCITQRSVIVEKYNEYTIVYAEHGPPIVCGEDELVFKLKQED